MWLGRGELGRGWDERMRRWGGGVCALLGVSEDQGSVLIVDVGRAMLIADACWEVSVSPALVKRLPYIPVYFSQHLSR